MKPVSVILSILLLLAASLNPSEVNAKSVCRHKGDNRRECLQLKTSDYTPPNHGSCKGSCKQGSGTR